ncbi:hypothetical protein IMSAG249_02264 [Lachnospiraceae bacterium]|nr:hypothetical protein IMSAG249_02264 [Lachnospiraceae bacterium]
MEDLHKWVNCCKKCGEEKRIPVKRNLTGRSLKKIMNPMKNITEKMRKTITGMMAAARMKKRIMKMMKPGKQMAITKMTKSGKQMAITKMTKSGKQMAIMRMMRTGKRMPAMRKMVLMGRTRRSTMRMRKLMNQTETNTMRMTSLMK